MRIISISSLAATLFACASAPPPPPIVVSNAPRAALHLQLAREETGHATALIDRGRRHDADGMLMRAQADADLAVALSREGAARTDALQALAQVRKLQETK